MNCFKTMKPRQCCTVAIMFLLILIARITFSAPIQVTIEPDAYAHTQLLNTISPFVTLSTAVPPSDSPTFNVVAYTDAAGASTGTNVFAHGGGIPFWATIRKLRMD